MTFCVRVHVYVRMYVGGKQDLITKEVLTLSSYMHVCVFMCVPKNDLLCACACDFTCMYLYM